MVMLASPVSQQRGCVRWEAILWPRKSAGWTQTPGTIGRDALCAWHAGVLRPPTSEGARDPSLTDCPSYIAQREQRF